MEMIYKYPRTCHIEGSRIQAGDEDLKNVRFDEIKDKFVVLEEKVDGANCGISFSEYGKLMLQSRGHFLNGGCGERQFDLFKTWASCYQAELRRMLGKRYVMYGEWLYAKHTVYYDWLTHYFMEFDIYDKETGVYLSTAARRELLKQCPFVESVLVLYEGRLDSLNQLVFYLGRSHFKSDRCEDSLREQCEEQGQNWELVKRQTDMSDLMEGIYIKVEEDGVVTDRFKYVRSTFLNTILDSETHWLNRPLLPNRLAPGRHLFPQAEGRVISNG